MSSQTCLFDFSFISTKLQSLLPTGFILRPLDLNDFDKGFVTTLGQLSVVDGLDASKFQNIFNSLKRFNTYVIVIENTLNNQIVASGAVLVELKFLRGGGLVGHIEDIVTCKNYRGKDFGKLIIEQLKDICVKLNCYKIILDCSEKNIEFYEKCGFKRKEVQMVIYTNKESKL